MYKPRTIPILKRLVPSLHKRAVRLIWPNGQGVVKREGALFLLDLKYTCDRFILTNGIDEPAQRQYFFDNLRQRNCDVFIDIGANIGTYTILAGLKTNCREIYAFEPSPSCYDRLRAQLMLNHLSDKVKTFPAAVSSQKGSVSFAVDPRGNHLFSKIESEGTGQAVPSVRLDDEIKLTGRRIGIKMDIEGHEMAALPGMLELLRNNDCFLQSECWPENAERFIAAMKKEGYSNLHRIDEDYYFVKQKA